MVTWSCHFSARLRLLWPARVFAGCIFASPEPWGLVCYHLAFWLSAGCIVKRHLPGRSVFWSGIAALVLRSRLCPSKPSGPKAFFVFNPVIRRIFRFFVFGLPINSVLSRTSDDLFKTDWAPWDASFGRLKLRLFRCANLRFDWVVCSFT